MLIRSILHCSVLSTTIAAIGCSGGASGPTAENGVSSQSQALAGPTPLETTTGLLARLGTPTHSVSTVPVNGDVNPYGVAFVPPAFPHDGPLQSGDILVANFNDQANLQGTGTTITRVRADGAALFFADAAAPGLSTALGVLSRGFVLVGSVPSSDGTGVCTQSGAREEGVGSGGLLVIDRRGRLVKTLKSARRLNGPWDLTIADFGSHAQVFVSDALDGSVSRLDLRVDDDDVSVERETRIASGYVHRCDSAAFVVGPTGLALDADGDTLFVSATGDNAIFAVDGASTSNIDRGRGRVVVLDSDHLHGPLGLARTDFGHLISAQGDAVNPDANQPSEIVEFTSAGAFVREFSIDSAPGSAFGLAVVERGGTTRFAAVDDGQNVLDVWDLP